MAEYTEREKLIAAAVILAYTKPPKLVVDSSEPSSKTCMELVAETIHSNVWGQDKGATENFNASIRESAMFFMKLCEQTFIKRVDNEMENIFRKNESTET